MRATSKPLEAAGTAGSSTKSLSVLLITLRFQPSIEPIQNCLVKLGPNRFDLYLANHLFRETIGQKITGQIVMKSASFQIKQLVFVNLPDGRAMRTLHIVSKDLKLRLGVDPGFVRQRQLLIRLHCVGLLRIVANKNLAIENRTRFAVQNTFIELMAGAVGLPMIDNRVSVRVLSRGY